MWAAEHWNQGTMFPTILRVRNNIACDMNLLENAVLLLSFKNVYNISGKAMVTVSDTQV